MRGCGQQRRLLMHTYYVSLLQQKIDPLSGSCRRTPDSVSGATDYMGFFSFYVTYLETCQHVAAGFVRSTLGGLNLLDHRAYKNTVLIHNGGAS